MPHVGRATLVYVVLGLTAGLSGVTADNLVLTPKIPASQCIEGCTLPLGLVIFSDMNNAESSTSARQCGSSFYLKSVYACAERFCSVDDVRAGWTSLQETCVEAGGEHPFPSAEELVGPTGNDLQMVDCVVNKGKKFGKVIIPTESNFALAYRTTWVADKQLIYAHAFGWALWILVGSIAVAGLVLRFLSFYARRLRSPQSVCRHTQSPSRSRFNLLRTTLRKHLAIPALFGYTHSQPAFGLFTIPTRLQSFWIGLYILLNFIFCCVGYELFSGNFSYTSKRDQLCTYIANRTGIIAWYNLPLVWLLAGRNDFLLFLTGVSYSNLNIFHRWAARIFAVEAIVHSACYTWRNRAVMHIVRDKLFWRAGVAATCLTVLTMIVAFLPIRKRAYEFFLVSHILIGVSLLVMLYYHVLVQQQRYDPWLWACIAIWSFDRCLRYIRLAFLSSKAIRGRNAEAIIIGVDNGLIRLTVTTSTTIPPRAGQYYFLYHPRSITPWENHPFTLASWKKEGGQTKLTFLIAVHGGGTRRLRSRIESGETTMRVLVEGPYGHEQPLGTYDHLLFLAGGSGITAILPYLDKFKRSPHIRSIAVMWCVKNNAYASDVLRKELANCEEVTINVTKERRNSDITLVEIVRATDENNKEMMAGMDSRSTMGSEEGTNIVFGRPCFRSIVDGHVKRLQGAEKLAVMACGPAGMMDDLREIMANMYGAEEGQVLASQVDYFEEAFSW